MDSAAVGRRVWRPQPEDWSAAEAAARSCGGCRSPDAVQAAPCRPDVSGEPTSWQGALGSSVRVQTPPSGAHLQPLPEVLPPDSGLPVWGFSVPLEGRVRVAAGSSSASGGCTLHPAVSPVVVRVPGWEGLAGRGHPQCPGPSAPWPAGSRRASVSVEGLTGGQGASSLPGSRRGATFPPAGWPPSVWPCLRAPSAWLLRSGRSSPASCGALFYVVCFSPLSDTCFANFFPYNLHVLCIKSANPKGTEVLPCVLWSVYGSGLCL